MSVLNPVEQSLYDVAKAALPSWLFAATAAIVSNPQELIGADAKVFGAVKVVIDSWLVQAHVTTATGFWLDQHAIDRNTRRRSGESDAALRLRLRQYGDVATRPALKAAINAALVQAGISTPCYIVNLREEKAFFAYPGGHQAVAYINRGYRMSVVGRPMRFIVILPYGTSSVLRSAVDEIIRQLKAGGFAYSIEVRGVP